MSNPFPLVVYARTFGLVVCFVVLDVWQSLVPATQPEPTSSQPPEARLSASLQPVASTSKISPEVNEEFRGHHRARAKTGYAMVGDTLAPFEKFDDLEALRAFLRPQIDQIMRNRYPYLSKADTDASKRVAEERHNVSVVAYIHAVKHETGTGGDNDFHVILGSSPMPNEGMFLTAEASALPHDGPHRNLLANARQELLSIVGHCHCNGRFKRMSPPIRVQVSGSLFFDGVHATGAEGPKYAKPFTVWEIHPILSIARVDGVASEGKPPVAADPSVSTGAETQ